MQESFFDKKYLYMIHILLMNINKYRDWVWALLLLDEWTQAQLAQYNKFIKNEFKN